jgi:hypothetical protein
MGCYDKTCCLTNTSISSGEKCLVVTLNNAEKQGLYDISQRVFQQERYEEKGLKNVESVVKDVFYGTYNDYGAIEEVEKIPQDYEKFRMDAQMFHVWAVEYLFSTNIDTLIKKPVRLVRDLYSKMNFLRKSPFDLSLSGQQHRDIKEMELMLKLNRKTNEYLESKIEEYKLNMY